MQRKRKRVEEMMLKGEGNVKLGWREEEIQAERRDTLNEQEMSQVPVRGM